MLRFLVPILHSDTGFFYFVAMNLQELREHYTKGGLHDEAMPENPIPFFELWLKEALEAEVIEPNAMALATVDSNGNPDVRIVLLKGLSGREIVFYTNYDGQKGQQLDAHPHASATFWWGPLERQVRVRGAIRRQDREISEAYFRSRPRASRLGAWASPQSEEVADREALDALFTAAEERFPGDKIPMPPNWGGYILTIDEIEFWQGRGGRMHDRFRYWASQAAGQGGQIASQDDVPPGQDDQVAWTRKRLAP